MANIKVHESIPIELSDLSMGDVIRFVLTDPYNTSIGTQYYAMLCMHGNQMSKKFHDNELDQVVGVFLDDGVPLMLSDVMERKIHVNAHIKSDHVEVSVHV